MFNIGLKIIPQADPKTLVFTDNSSGDETVTSASIQLTKTDLLSVVYDFTGPFTLGQFTMSQSILDKDYAFELVYIVVTNADTYTLEYRFVTLGYSNLIKKNREFVDSNKLSLADQEEFRKETLSINYYRMVAKDRCRFSDIIGAQKTLDYIADLGLNDKWSLCSC